MRKSLADQAALDTFQAAAQRVPAYKDFLKTNGINPDQIKTIVDFQKVPPITKENYLTKYPLHELLWDGKMESANLISMSSGSSGKPFAWPRGKQNLADSIKIMEPIYESFFHTKEKETLVIIAFAMGTWIGGTYILGGSLGLFDRNHRINCITPGINRDEIIYILKNLAPQYEQVILAGYPPFIKDVIDEALRQEIDFSKLSLKFLLAGENISEKWRAYLLSHTHNAGKLDACILLYGTADAGIMAHETPLSILLRKTATENPKLFTYLFQDSPVIPTLVEYDPMLRYIEVDEDNYFLFTISTELPLIRYKILDKGRLISSIEIAQIIGDFAIDLPENLPINTIGHYLALYGRTDISVIFYALNIYPENIKYGLEQPEVEYHLTGKFTARTIFADDNQEQSFHIDLELQKGTKQPSSTIQQEILDAIIRSIRAHNSEYNKLCQELSKKVYPVLHFLPFGSSEFTIKIKHRWTVKS